MKIRFISFLFLLFISFHSLYSQDKGWGTEIEFSAGKGFRAQIPSVTCGVDLVEGFCFHNGLFLGGGIGTVYANGLLQEIHQSMTDGSSVDLTENTITDVGWGAKAFLCS